MPQVPTTFPAAFGSFALLKQLSDEGERSVYLAASNGAAKSWAVKVTPIPAGIAANPAFLQAETQSLCGMRSPHLAQVFDCQTVAGEVAVAMEHVPGKSLAAICERAESLSALLPSELGVILAHDVFAAMECFYDFEGAGRVHGNLSPRTILVGYSGEVKLAGYRPGLHSSDGIKAHADKDLTALANILCDLPFRMFPKELVQLVPRLLEDSISPAESVAATRTFVRVYLPSADDRQKVAAWLDEIFPGERERDAQECQQLLAAGIRITKRLPAVRRTTARGPAIGKAIAERETTVVFRRSRLKVIGIVAVAALAVAGSVTLLRANRRAPIIPAVAPRAPEPLPAQGPPDAQPDSQPPAPDLAIAVATAEPVMPNAPAAPEAQTQAKPEARGDRLVKRKPAQPSVEQLLRSADAAFEGGRHGEAIKLGTQALAAGGGVRAHLALANYFRNMSRYREALQHYRAAIKADPENAVAAAGIKVVERQLQANP